MLPPLKQKTPRMWGLINMLGILVRSRWLRIKTAKAVF